MAGKQPARTQSATARSHLRSFHELMRHRVRRILLISSSYDSFIMSEEGHLEETLLGHFLDLNLGHTPDLVQRPDCEQALALLAEDDDFDLIVSSVSAVDGNAAEFARRVSAAGYDAPVIGLAYTNRELSEFIASEDTSALERVFLWQGDVRIFLAMVKYLEDRLNVEADCGERGVPIIILIEDSIPFYSSFLPVIYTEIFRHTQHMLSEDLNPSQKMLRMRARPKVILCDHFEEAWAVFERYEAQVAGVVSDFRYPRGGVLDPRAGLELCTGVLERRSDVRIVMQSSDPANQKLAEEIGSSFLLKGSPVLLQQLRSVLIERFGFGDFIFRLPDGTEVDRATGLRSLANKLVTIPAESIAYHAERNHFSNWLKARTELALAERLRPQRVEDFDGIEHLREHLLHEIDEFRLEQHRTVIAEFDADRFEPRVSITRIGTGSLGGKARGMAFANRVLRDCGIDQTFPNIEIFVAPFPRGVISDLQSYLGQIRFPLAVRSSSLLEDSLSQPFAGVYETHMLPNSALELQTRWNQLAYAIKRVYASTFLRQAKAYLSMTPYRLEEEKMAVIVQQAFGMRREERFYPDFAGVGRSHNFYPEPGHKADDGVAAVALGLGHTVVGGDPCLRFCPRFPQQLLGFSSVRDALDNSQRDFRALDVSPEARESGVAEVMRLPLDIAERDGLMQWLGSTHVVQDDRIVEGISRPGVRIVSFAQVLRHGVFPLAEVLSVLLERCAEAAGTPVEIEFAGSLPSTTGGRGQLAFLQLRPMAMDSEIETVALGDLRGADVVCHSTRVLGNGRLEGIRDLIVVDERSFERHRSQEVARDVARFDAVLRREGRPYVLIGVGRWGSSDPYLGIPVGWEQIAGARVIVEAGFRDFKVAPSQGTHFFQNLCSSGVGYFTVNPDVGEGRIDWDWLAALPAQEETELVRRVRSPEPLLVKMDGRVGEGAILRS
jgi:hypothetical protein